VFEYAEGLFLDDISFIVPARPSREFLIGFSPELVESPGPDLDQRAKIPMPSPFPACAAFLPLYLHGPPLCLADLVYQIGFEFREAVGVRGRLL